MVKGAGDGDCEEDGHDDGYDCDFAVVVAATFTVV